MNHAFVFSFVVPVLPATGTSHGTPNERIRMPEPRSTTSLSIDTMIQEVRSSRTSSLSMGASQSTSPSAFSIRRIGRGVTRMPMLANVV